MARARLGTLGIDVKDLVDNQIYLCVLKDKKQQTVRPEPDELAGIELKAMADMNGLKKGMIRYNKEYFYDVIGVKEEAPTK